MVWAIVSPVSLGMKQTRLFNHSRGRLAAYYAGAMGLILALCGVAVYEMTAQDHWRSLDQELTSLVGTLHDALEPLLAKPGTLAPEVRAIIPNLCQVAQPCPAVKPVHTHLLNASQQPGYYIRFFDLEGNLLAKAGENPPGLPFERRSTRHRPLMDQGGNRYHQASLPLKNRLGQPWGYLKVGRSLAEYEAHLRAIQLFLALGLPVTLGLAGIAGWALAGVAMAPVYRSYEQLRQFSADVAHELRTPISAIQATAETTLGAEHSLEEADSTLEIIQRQNQRLIHLIQDLLLLSRMELGGSAVIPRRPCCLKDLVNDLAEEFAGLALAGGITLQAEILSPEPVWVLGNEDHLYRLVGNLLSNALHYTPRGGRVTLSLQREKQRAILMVQDTGIGITPSEQERIFERFYRLDSARSRQTGGAGLGLAIARAIAVRHGGSLGVKSEPQRGSIFTVTLPLWSHGAVST
ncbi:MAG: two-component system sensor histidine kinase RppB [Cyanobacteriota bacterium]